MKLFQGICMAFLVCLHANVRGQENGIVWAQNLNWPQILEKAKSENKYILLDCFATWCGPCREMDKDVYTDKMVGDFVNEKFLTVKVQMDKSPNDNQFVKDWYNDAVIIQRNFGITAFPTFIFLAPDGTPLHRAVGYRNASDFIALTKDALNPDKQYYSLAKNYIPGKFDTSELKGLARALHSSGGELSGKLACEYLTRIPKIELGNGDNINLMCEFAEDSLMQLFVSNYLRIVPRNHLSDSVNRLLVGNFYTVKSVRDLVIDHLRGMQQKELENNLQLLTIFKNDDGAKLIANRYINSISNKEMFLKRNIYFINDFTKKSSERGFKFFYNNSKEIDRVINSKNFAMSLILNTITDEEYEGYYKEAIKSHIDNVPWVQIFEKVKKMYNQVIAERLNVHLRAALYGSLANKEEKYWSPYIDYYIQDVDKYELDTTVQNGFRDAIMLNNFVYNVVLFHSSKPDHIAAGLRWMERVIRRDPKNANHIDTYANLLYKANRIKEAIMWQEKAVQVANEYKETADLPAIEANLAKMKKGEPTWIKP